MDYQRSTNQRSTNGDATMETKSLESLTMSELVAFHNDIAAKVGAKEAGPKTFSTRAKAIARIGKMVDESGTAEVGPICKLCDKPAAPNSSFCAECADDGIDEPSEDAAPSVDLNAVDEIPAATVEAVNAETERHEDELHNISSLHIIETPAPTAPVPTATAEKVKRVARPDGLPTIRARAEELLLQGGKDDAEVGDSPTAVLTYADIIEVIRKEYGSHTTVACLRWYATRMREEGKQLPERPRAKAPKKVAVEVKAE